jgi:ABC-2 type transport system ATP-binding protein
VTTPETSSAVIPVPGILVQNVSRSFGPVHAVRDATLEARPGKVTALIGPNGSGKTTLMLMLASLLKPDAGAILIGGADPVTDAETVRSRLGWMPDVLGSWNALTVRSALEITGQLYRMPKATAAARASELIDLVGLQPLAAQQTRVLSRGQKQKLSLARALVNDPSVLLLDEPASGLDPVARHDLQVLVRRLAAEGKTVLVSSHVLAELDWRIRSLDPTSLLAALVATGIAADDVVADRTELIVALGGEADAAALLSKLVASGVAISSFAPAVGDLEHTFLDLSRTTQSRAAADRQTDEGSSL